VGKPLFLATLWPTLGPPKWNTCRRCGLWNVSSALLEASGWSVPELSPPSATGGGSSPACPPALSFDENPCRCCAEMLLELLCWSKLPKSQFAWRATSPVDTVWSLRREGSGDIPGGVPVGAVTTPEFTSMPEDPRDLSVCDCAGSGGPTTS
jgi:hypothetical protein